ncbi:hypothetical protein H6F77_19895 [Microcoleus sp. FACHB-831]|uniref:hypothetical protein n=1 Tax=Microcoleus sp. FACHB-831 TaxID=2692827 RepID=UPI0016825394|nr:hypothetical protein [Microcoleus sp. FACHB-831]MBD1923314.1 hypothetical protein [Microcoleus sp. FACHB-831]
MDFDFKNNEPPRTPGTPREEGREKGEEKLEARYGMKELCLYHFSLELWGGSRDAELCCTSYR